MNINLEPLLKKQKLTIENTKKIEKINETPLIKKLKKTEEKNDNITINYINYTEDSEEQKDFNMPNDINNIINIKEKEIILKNLEEIINIFIKNYKKEIIELKKENQNLKTNMMMKIRK